jgi:hypothetical protein
MHAREPCPTHIDFDAAHEKLYIACMNSGCSNAEDDVLQAGGRAQTVQHGQFRFDTGPSLLLFPDTYRQDLAASLMRSQSAHNDMQHLLTAAGLCQAGRRALS